jgi:hypothetical protein
MGTFVPDIHVPPSLGMATLTPPNGLKLVAKLTIDGSVKADTASCKTSFRDSYVSSTEGEEAEQDKLQSDISPLAIRDDLQKPFMEHSHEKDFLDRENEFLDSALDANSGTSLEAQIAQLIQETESMQEKLDLGMKNDASDLVLQFEHLNLKRDYLKSALRLQERNMI